MSLSLGGWAEGIFPFGTSPLGNFALVLVGAEQRLSLLGR